MKLESQKKIWPRQWLNPKHGFYLIQNIDFTSDDLYNVEVKYLAKHYLVDRYLV